MSFGQGGASWGPGGDGTPDWAALAEESAARARRKKLMMIGGGALAIVAIGAIVTTAVVTSNGGGTGKADKNASQLPAPAELPEDTSAPAPSFSPVAPPPPPDPKDYISSAEKDRAPITVDGFFPGKKLAMGDRVHLKGATSSTAKCTTGTQGALGPVLTNNGCDRLIRATYRKDGVAVCQRIILCAHGFNFSAHEVQHHRFARAVLRVRWRGQHAQAQRQAGAQGHSGQCGAVAWRALPRYGACRAATGVIRVHVLILSRTPVRRPWGGAMLR